MRLHRQPLALYRLAGQPVAQGSACVIELGDFSGAGIQGDVLVGAGLREIGAGQQAVANGNVAGRIKLDRALDRQRWLGCNIDVFNAYAAGMHLQWRMKGELVDTLNATDAHRALACCGVRIGTAARVVAQHDLAEPAVLDAAELEQGQVQGRRNFPTGACDLHAQAQGLAAHLKHTTGGLQSPAIQNIDFVAFKQDVAAVDVDDVLEFNQCGTSNHEVAAGDRQLAGKGDDALGIDGQGPGQGDILVENDRIGQVAGNATDRQRLQRIRSTDGAKNFHDALGPQGQVIGRAVAIAIQGRKTIDAYAQAPGA